MKPSIILPIASVGAAASVFAFTLRHPSRISANGSGLPERIAAAAADAKTSTLLLDASSPFEEGDEGDVATASGSETLEGPLDLTWENVDAVLDEMRPFLIQDGGNVKIAEIDGPVVRLQLEVG